MKLKQKRSQDAVDEVFSKCQYFDKMLLVKEQFTPWKMTETYQVLRQVNLTQDKETQGTTKWEEEHNFY